MADLPTANEETTDAFGAPAGASIDVAPSGTKAPEPAGTSTSTAAPKTDERLSEGLSQ